MAKNTALTDLSDCGEACDEDAVRSEPGVLVLAELDEAAQPVQLHHLLRQLRVVAQSAREKGKSSLNPLRIRNNTHQ